jgi:anti-anti-sigma factor
VAVPFTINDSVDAGVARLVLGGEVDLAVISTIRQHVTAQLKNDDVREIVIDLSATTFMDSSGIGELISCRRLATEAGKTLRAIGAQGRVADVLDLSGVTAFLATHVPIEDGTGS